MAGAHFVYDIPGLLLNEMLAQCIQHWYIEHNSETYIKIVKYINGSVPLWNNGRKYLLLDSVEVCFINWLKLKQFKIWSVPEKSVKRVFAVANVPKEKPFLTFFEKMKIFYGNRTNVPFFLYGEKR